MLTTYKNCVCIYNILCILICCEGIETTKHHKLYRFDTRPIRDAEKYSFQENYIDINVNKHSIPFKSISYCLRIAPKDLFSQCIFSEEGFKFIFIDENKEYGFLSFHGIYYIFKFPEEITIVPRQWHHVCVSYKNINIAKAQVKMFFDGISLIDKEIHPPNDSTVFILKTTWRLGYCKESVLDPNVEITRGSIRDFSAWSRALTDEEMLTFTRDCSTETEKNELKPDIIEWNTMHVNQTGLNVETEFISFKQKEKVLFEPHCKTVEFKHPDTKKHKVHSYPVCNEDLINLKFSKMTFEEATLNCHQLGGIMPLPRSFEEAETLTESASKSKTKRRKEECNTYWLPIVHNEGNNREVYKEYDWVHYKFNVNGSNKAVRFLPWQLGEPNGQEFQKCVVLAPETQLYYDVNCKESHCFFCSVCKQIHFTLRGLTKGLSKEHNSRNGIDSRYIYIPKFDDTKQQEIRLEGYYGHTINLNKAANQWEILSVDNGTVGTLTTEQHYPFGKHIWNVNSAGIFGDTTMNKKEVLKLSVCNQNSQFTCDDGTCVSIDERCNEILNCNDGSDEDRCEIIIIGGTSYHKLHPPFNVQGNRPLDVLISFDIFMLSEFREVGFSYRAEFLITVKWLDHRLEFVNLRDNMFKNLIASPEKETLWIPPLIFNNSEKNTMLTVDRGAGEPRANIWIQKRGKPKIALPAVLDEAVFYKGSENLVVFGAQYNLLFNCIYELGYYPFDIQTCTIEIKSTLLMKDHIRLLAGDVQYRGPTSIFKHDVKNVSIHSERPNHVFVEIKLKRRCLSHLAATYFPTLCILLIAQILLFLNEEHFEATIMASLTAMLAMYTLHQTMLAQLPKTSYLKIIDIWLLFGLTILFLVFTLEVTSEIIRAYKKQQKRSGAKIVKSVQCQIPTEVKDNKPILTKRARSISTTEDGSETVGICNNSEYEAAAFRAHKSTQANQKDLKSSENFILMHDSSTAADTFTLYEKIILSYKVTIPAITTAFIIGYAITVVTVYAQ